MTRHCLNNLEWLSFSLFEQFPKLRTAVLLRKGGVSKKPYDSLNLVATHGDDLPTTKQNVQIVKETLQTAWNLNESLNLHHAMQVHAKDCALVTQDSPIFQPNPADILLTNTPGKDLAIFQADCQAAVFYDPKEHALALSHCGWKGNIQNVYQTTVDAMHKCFGSLPKNLYVAISPSLGPCHSEFINYKTEWPKSFWKYEVKPLYFDLWAMSKEQLLDAGILETHIQMPTECTYDHPEDYFSYRRDKLTGRNTTIALLL